MAAPASGSSPAAAREGFFRVTSDPLDAVEIASAVSDPSCGGISTFIGTVRGENAGRRVLYLDYECYEGLAVKSFARIAAEAAAAWPDARVAIAHRTGRVHVGEPSVLVAAASSHRAEAFAACRYAIERLKQIAPIWKRECFEGGEVWIEGATADPDDQAARQQAMARACA